MSNQRTQTQSRSAQQSPLRPPNKGPDQPPAVVEPANGNGKAQSAEEKTIEYTPLGESISIKLTIDMVRKHLCLPTKQGHWPDDSTIIKYMMTCRQRRLNPWVGDCYLLGYDTKNGPKFSIVVAVQALFKRAEISDQFDGIESGVVVITKDDEVIERQGDLVFRGEQLVGGWAAVYRKDRAKPFYQRLALSTYRKDTPQWQSDGPGMITKCCESGALRQAFPSDIGGLYLEQELHEMAMETTPSEKPKAEMSTAQQLKDRLASQERVVGKAPQGEQDTSQTRQDAPESTGQNEAQDAGEDSEGPFDDESGEDLSQTEDATGKGAPKQQEDIKFG